jgi:hypothetical protein
MIRVGTVAIGVTISICILLHQIQFRYSKGVLMLSVAHHVP